ncbi:transcriptional regulator [Fictibacillus macauensis ZFHKF-1]|uniref:Transcriptional regulator n=1 Tax=Fictibacillus macauensis ZFHKF-1 TaxID=1196324 RepID=I8AFW1_9BACL|nr:MerR family transcriptional regulator [Fictibacillus macauensis]EIT84279.1 transcriptional regulator [Fictibacillus macauensis ZFHKF-1]
MHWTTGEVAKTRGISVRTLRYYDQIGLLTPSLKNDYGKRYYSQEDLFTLEKILLLKSLALPLKDIRRLLNTLSYPELLAAHHKALQEDLQATQKRIRETSSLLAMFKMEGEVPWETVISLSQQPPEQTKKWQHFFQQDELQQLTTSIPNTGNLTDTTNQYIVLLQRINICLKENQSPRSKEGYTIGQALTELAQATFGDNQALAEKFWEVRQKPSEETGLYPLSQEVLAFVESCTAYYAETCD